ncbi:DUF1653 domain-containing protein [Komagataeibacter intermedius]|uniref:DUF1653 domain-containing protein n=1 Tax=Komagataeibacter intermedius NRIC 0521 TaxID=1307934 RepID=A0ABQ0PGQ2_9PROT|nr:DUF1653 domain-containing protein [Komagataeibacter intermedius]GAN86393.1 hypothetical protein Gain_0027_068 [Komagataeibacter intermedius TF2]GBQ68087.1 hypothetical protein AA0521_1151 [Komagataeibacter intermedius NRIC 0521]
MSESTYRHKKRGGLYIVHGRATLQVDGPHDMAECVIYSSTADGRVWVRPASEFFDGRFEEVQS